MKYSILKDINPENTVEKIKNILNSIGITVNELFQEIRNETEYSPQSCRLTTFGIWRIGTNGKGTSKINTLASGYGEYMERLQNQMFPVINASGPDFYFAPDEIVCNINSIDKNILQKLRISFETLSILDKIAKNCSFYSDFINNENNKENIILIPFYSIKDKKLVNLPLPFFKVAQITNGMAAGNTYEEAIVQGLSEILERYALKYIMTEKPVLPDIPEELYIQYDTIRGMIEYCKSNNWEIRIKDASLGKGLPVICMIFENKIQNIFTICFGAQPSLPIAIERTITEFMQGSDISSDWTEGTKIKFFTNEHLKYLEEKDKGAVLYSLILGKVGFKGNVYYKNIFNNNTASSSFSKDAWILSQENIDNKKLLQFLIERVKNISDEIYIRDVSFLDFPAVNIYIPSMSCIRAQNEDFLQQGLNYMNWLNLFEDKQDIQIQESEFTIEKLLDAIEYAIISGDRFQYGVLSYLPLEYLALLCLIVLKDITRINTYINIIISKNDYSKSFNKDGIIRLCIVKDYFNLQTENLNINEVLYSLNEKYGEKPVSDCIKFINEISLDSIKKLIKRTMPDIIPPDEINKNTEKLSEAKKNLYLRYKNNIPNQMNLKSVFDFIK